jgi:hypothetical protein
VSGARTLCVDAGFAWPFNTRRLLYGSGTFLPPEGI